MWILVGSYGRCPHLTLHQTHMPAWVCVRIYPREHALGAQRGRTGVSLLQPLCSGRSLVAARKASRSRNLGSGNSAVTFTSSWHFCCGGQSVAESGERRREAEKELSWNKEWRSGERRSDVPRGWVSSEYRLTSDFSFSISHLEVCLSLPFGVRSERSEQESQAHGCHFWRSDFSFWFFVFFSAFGLFFFQEMPSCSLTDAGLCCWSSQDAGDSTTTRFLTLRQISVIFPVWT